MPARDVIFRLIGIDSASPAFNRAAASAEGAAGRITRAGDKMGAAGRKMNHLVTLPILAIGAASVKAATDFNSSMTRIQTQAGGTARDVQILSKQVLAMKGVQQGPNELAMALYHLKSVGMDNVSAMRALRQASDLAAVGHANLEETTNALAGAWRTGIPGAKNFHQAVATINAVIGAGNMTLEQFNMALGTGILPSAKTFGLTLKDVGSALALFTDEGVPADTAATRLRMSFSLLGAPSKAAEKQLASIGLTGLRLADDMRKPNGLIRAIGDLKTHLEDPKYKLSLSQQAQLLSRAFGGGRSSSAILSMINNFDVLKQKQDQVTASLSKYNQSVAAQKATPEAVFKTRIADLERNAVVLGTKLLPVAVDAVKEISKIVGGIADDFQHLSAGNKKLLIELGLAVVALGPVLTIGGRITKAFGLMWAAAANTSRFLAAMRGVQLSEDAMGTGAYKAGQKVNSAFGGVGNAAGRLFSNLTSAATGALAGYATKGIGGTGGWLSAVLLGGGAGWVAGGPVGGAIGAVSSLIFHGIGLWKDHAAAAKQAAAAEAQYVNSLTSAIEQDNGAIAKNTRLMQVRTLGQGGSKSLLNQAISLHIPLNDVVNASLGNGKALQGDIVGGAGRLLSRQAAINRQILAESQKQSPNEARINALKAESAAIDVQLGKYKTLQDALAKMGIDVGKATKQWQIQFRALNANRVATGGYADQLKELRHSQTLAENTDGSLMKSLTGTGLAAEHNRGVIVKLAAAAQLDAEKTFQAQVKHEGWRKALQDAQGTLSAHVKQILAAADAAGLNTKNVLSLITGYKHLPKSVVTYIRHHGGLPAYLLSLLNGPSNRTISVTVNANTAGNLGSTYASQVPVFKAAGGYVRGAGSGMSDSIPARLSNGEFVVNARSTARNLPLLQSINSNPRGFASGGLASVRAPVQQTFNLYGLTDPAAIAAAVARRQAMRVA